MNFNTTIILVALVLVVGAYFYFIESDLPSNVDTPSPTTTSRGEAVFGNKEFDGDRIDRIQIERDGQTIVLAREADGWWQVEPVRFPLVGLADPNLPAHAATSTWSAGRALIDAAIALRHTASAEPGSGNFPSLSEMKLDPPVAVVTFHGSATDESKQPIRHTIRLGRIVGSSAYLAVNDRKAVYFADAGLHQLAIDGRLNDWRIKSLRLPGEAAAQRVVFTEGEQHIEMVKQEGAWTFAAPHHGRVSRDAVRDLLTRAGTLSIASFVADNPADPSVFGLDQPTAQLTVHTVANDATAGDDAPATTARTLVIGRPADLSEQQFYATLVEDGKPSNVVFTVNRTERAKFAADLDKLRDPRLMLAAATDVQQMTLTRHDGTAIELNRGRSGWAFVEPGPGFAADHDAVATLVETLAQAKAAGYIPNATVSDDPLAQLTLSAIARPEPEVLRIFGRADMPDKRLILRNDETTAYIVDANVVAPFFEPVTALRNRDVLDLTADKLAALTLERPDGVQYTFERSAASDEASAEEANDNTPRAAAWRLMGHDAFEEMALQRLLAAMLPLRATRWVDTQLSETVGYTLTLRTADDQTHRLIIDPATRIARTDTTEQCFEVTEELLQRLGEEYRNRTVLAFDSESIISVRLAHGSAQRTIAREGARYLDVAGDAVDEAAAAGLFDVLGGLRVERFLAPVSEDEPRDQLHTLTITTRNDETITLHLDPTNNRAFIDGRNEWFLLNTESTAALVRPLPGATGNMADDEAEPAP